MFKLTRLFGFSNAGERITGRGFQRCNDAAPQGGTPCGHVEAVRKMHLAKIRLDNGFRPTIESKTPRKCAPLAGRVNSPPAGELLARTRGRTTARNRAEAVLNPLVQTAGGRNDGGQVTRSKRSPRQVAQRPSSARRSAPTLTALSTVAVVNALRQSRETLRSAFPSWFHLRIRFGFRQSVGGMRSRADAVHEASGN